MKQTPWAPRPPDLDREAAYALFEARGREHGHDLADWFAAEAALDAAPGQAASEAVAAKH